MSKKKPIGLWSAVSIGIGGMIGGGIFAVLGVATEIAGNAIYISFMIAGIVALLSTYSYAKLSARYPTAGGPVEFFVKGYGDSVLAGALNIFMWVAYLFAMALYARAFGGFAMTFLPAGTPTIWLNIISTSIVLVFMGVNFIGAKAVGRSEMLVVIVKVLILVMFIVIGFFFIEPANLSPTEWPSTAGIFLGAGIVFLAYEGFGLITNAADDMENPRKTIPKALYISVIITFAIYVLVSFVVVGNLPIPDIIDAEDYALAAAATPFLGVIGFKIIALAALFSTSSAINATLYGGANISYEAAKKGELPKFFERKVWGRSTEGLFISAGLVIVIVNFMDLEGIATLHSAGFLFIYAAVSFAHHKLRKETGGKSYIIWPSIIGCALSLAVLIYYESLVSPAAPLLFILVLLGCFLFEYVYRKRTSRCLKPRI